MKLYQLNIWQGRLILNVRRFFETHGAPDVLCLQEACSMPNSDEFSFNNIEELQKNFDLPHIHFAPVMDFRLGAQKVFFGNAILSRHKVEPVTTVFTHGTYKTDMQFLTEDKFTWNFQHATINGTHIVNHHGFWVPGVKTGNAETTRQMDMIADYIKTLQGPVIFTGDLNLLPESPSLARLNAEMTNLCVTNNIKTTRNFTSYNLTQVCDYIFVRDVKVNGFKVHDDVVSDHALLELDFG